MCRDVLPSATAAIVQVVRTRCRQQVKCKEPMKAVGMVDVLQEALMVLLKLESAE